MVRLALYKAPGDLYDRAIRAWTRSPYSHCELVLSGGRFVSSQPRNAGMRAKMIKPNLESRKSSSSQGFRLPAAKNCSGLGPTPL